MKVVGNLIAAHRLRLGVVALSLPLLLAACTGGVAGGTVSGHLLRVGGPVGAGSPPLSGTVTFTSSSGTVTKVHASASGGFHSDLPAGTYTLTGTSPALNDGELICYSNPRMMEMKSESAMTQDVFCSIR